MGVHPPAELFTLKNKPEFVSIFRVRTDQKNRTFQHKIWADCPDWRDPWWIYLKSVLKVSLAGKCFISWCKWSGVRCQVVPLTHFCWCWPSRLASTDAAAFSWLGVCFLFHLFHHFLQAVASSGLNWFWTYGLVQLVNLNIHQHYVSFSALISEFDCKFTAPQPNERTGLPRANEVDSERTFNSVVLTFSQTMCLMSDKCTFI